MAHNWGLAVPELFSQMMEKSILFTEAPDHTRLKRLASSVFLPASNSDMRTRVMRCVARRLDEVSGRDEIDLVRDLTEPLWLDVFSDWVGLSPEARLNLSYQWRAARHLVDPSATVLDPDDLLDVFFAMDQLYEFFFSVFRDGEVAEESLIGRLKNTQLNGDRLDEQEIVFACIMFLLGGNETVCVRGTHLADVLS